MKFMSKFTAGLVSVSLSAVAFAQEPVTFNVPGISSPAQPAAPAPKAAPTPAPAAVPSAPAAGKKFTDAQIAEAYGMYIGAQMGLRQLEFTKAEVEAIARGVVASVSTTPPAFDPQQMGPELENFLGKKQEAFLTKLRYANIAEGQAFFTKLAENKSVVRLPSGLAYEITKEAKGALPKAGQVVTMHYSGFFVNGQVFDTSLQPREEGEQPQPAQIALIAEQIMPGMFEGLQKIPVGAKAKLYVPPSLAYGDQGSQVIPPGATLIFEVEVLAAQDAPKEATPAKK
jgi:FKBP-type peptidyl-prolyl cis-trans isomerase